MFAFKFEFRTKVSCKNNTVQQTISINQLFNVFLCFRGHWCGIPPDSQVNNNNNNDNDFWKTVKDIKHNL